MNLQAAVNELGARSPGATLGVLVLEAVVMVGTSALLVGLFA